MPHISIKLWPGRSEEEKRELVCRIVKDVMETIHTLETSISVSIEEVPPEQWGEKVYQPEIIGKADTLYKKPGYSYEDAAK